MEPDGSRRTVSYAADPVNGFNAIVQKDPSISVRAPSGSGNSVAATSSSSNQVNRPATIQLAQPTQILTPRQPILTNVAPAAYFSRRGDANLLRQSVIYIFHAFHKMIISKKTNENRVFLNYLTKNN